MKSHRLIILISLWIAGSHLAFAQHRVFTDTSGREMKAKIEVVHEDKITVKRHDGKIYTIPLNKLSEADQAYAEEWKNQRTKEQAVNDTRKAAILRRKEIAEFCIRNFGQQVGNGECWTLANEAFKATGAKRPDGELRVWGRLVDIESEPIEPGDVVEFRTAKIPGYGTTGPEHTAVVIEGGKQGKCKIAEQNWGNIKQVRNVSVDLSKRVSGDVWVYRPE